MRTLIYACTYYQRIMAFLLANDSRFSSDDIDLLLLKPSTKMQDSSEEERLYVDGAFRRVFCIGLDDRPSALRKLTFFREMTSMSTRPIWFGEVGLEEVYDKFLFYNYDKYSMPLITYLLNTNPDTRIYRFEEGLISYTGYYVPSNAALLRRFADLRARMNGLPKIADSLRGCFYLAPEHVVISKDKPHLKLNGIDVSDGDIVGRLNAIFDYVPRAIDERFIFFEDCYANDGFRINDLELLGLLADCVGREDILVKRHPRAEKDRFTPLGYKVMPATSVPWEIVQMNAGLADKVLVSVASGTSISTLHLFSDVGNVLLLHKMMVADERVRKIAINGNFETLLELIDDPRVFAPESEDELRRALATMENAS